MAGKDDEANVLDDVFSSSRDRGADTAAPEPESKAEPAIEPEARATDTESSPEPKETDSQKQYRDPETGRFVPLHELKTERQKRQEEARLREEAERRASTYERQIQDLLARAVQPQQVQQPQPQPQQVQAPDPFSDPEGFRDFVFNQAQHKAQMIAQNERLHMSETLAIEKFGEEAVNKAFEEAQRRGIAGQFARMRHPYAEIVKWHQKQSRLDVIGDDFDGYEKRIREEERAKVLAELKNGGGKQQTQRFPGTLADGTSSGGQGAVLTDEAMMADVFGADRRSRKRA
jgi:hypothetical protein